MTLLDVYESFSDLTRLRILHLLTKGPLCVCHFQELLGEPQVKISKHLAYLKKKGIVEVSKQANWRIYRLPSRPTPLLARNLACLAVCAAEETNFKKDLKQRTLRGKSKNLSGPSVFNEKSCC